LHRLELCPAGVPASAVGMLMVWKNKAMVASSKLLTVFGSCWEGKRDRLLPACGWKLQGAAHVPRAGGLRAEQALVPSLPAPGEWLGRDTSTPRSPLAGSLEGPSVPWSGTEFAGEMLAFPSVPTALPIHLWPPRDPQSHAVNGTLPLCSLAGLQKASQINWKRRSLP